MMEIWRHLPRIAVTCTTEDFRDAEHLTTYDHVPVDEHLTPDELDMIEAAADQGPDPDSPEVVEAAGDESDWGSEGLPDCTMFDSESESD